jgi:lipoprotein-anchoring transpeptidase ErfK/SrfK
VSALRVSTTLLVLFAALVSAGQASAAEGQPVPAAPTTSAAWVAHIVIPTPAFTAPGGERLRTVIQTAARWNGGPVTLLVLGARVLANGTTWLKLRLPKRPNGSSAWINSAFAQLARTPWRVEISIARRTVSLLEDGRTIDRWRAVVGKPATPTPHGLFAIYERVREPSANDFDGTWALPLTAFSDVLQSFEGGPGQVAIHGRGGTSLIDPLGSARSHGCIRIDNGAMDVLAHDAAEGTPVEID